MDTPPKPTDLAATIGISVPYASQILTGTRTPSRALAIRCFRLTGWRHAVLTGLDDADIAVLEKLEPYVPRAAQQAEQVLA